MGQSSHLPCVCLTFTPNNLTEVYSAGDLHQDNDTHVEGDHPDSELAAPSPSAPSQINRSSETCPVNGPLPVAGVMLAKTPRMLFTHYNICFLILLIN